MICVTLGVGTDAARISVESMDAAITLIDFIATTEPSFAVTVERSE